MQIRSENHHTVDYDPFITSHLSLTQLRLGPYAVQIWSRAPQNSGERNPRVPLCDMGALEQLAVLAASDFGGARSHFLAQGIAAVERTADMWYPKVRILVRELQLQIRSDPYHTADYGPVISSQPVFVQSTLLPCLVQIW